MLTECRFDSFCFRDITERCTGAMGIQVIDVREIPARFAAGSPHCFGSTQTFLMRGGNMESIRCVAAAEQFAVNLRTSGFRHFVLFENQNAGTFTEHEAVAVLVEWALLPFRR